MKRNAPRIAAILALCLACVTHAVTCVSGLPPSNPDSAYTDQGNGTIMDIRTGLMWSKCLEGQDPLNACAGTPTARTWPIALSVASTQQLGGYTDWRLPNIKELRTLTEACRISPAINETIFPGTGASYVWSGTTAKGTTSSAWRLNVEYGDSELGAKTGTHSVRLVRGGYGSSLADVTPPTLSNISATTTTLTASSNEAA